MLNIREIFANVNGNNIISISTKTDVTLKGGKGNPQQGKVKKVMTGANVMVFQNKETNGYENMVKRRLIAEGKDPETFKLGPRPWGVRIEGTPIITHKDQDYLEVIFLTSGKSHYEIDGQIVDKEAIKGLPEETVNEEAQGSLEDKVIVRTFKAQSITEIKIDGKRYTVDE